MKKIMLGVMALSFVFMFTGASMAAMSWDESCGIERIGVAGVADNVFKVTSCSVSANDGKWLQLVKQKDTAMATLLTAFSLGNEVKLNADFAAATTDGSAYGPVEVIYMNK